MGRAVTCGIKANSGPCWMDGVLYRQIQILGSRAEKRNSEDEISLWWLEYNTPKVSLTFNNYQVDIQYINEN